MRVLKLSIALIIVSFFLIPLTNISANGDNHWSGTLPLSKYAQYASVNIGNHSTPFWLIWSYESSNSVINLSFVFWVNFDVIGWVGFPIGSGPSSQSGVYHWENPNYLNLEISLRFSDNDDAHANEDLSIDYDFTKSLTSPLQSAATGNTIFTFVILLCVAIPVLNYRYKKNRC